MTQPIHTGSEAKVSLLAAMSPMPDATELCDFCYGTGNLCFKGYDGCLYEMDKPCPDCGGLGELSVDQPTFLDGIDDYPDTLTDMGREKWDR